MNKNILEGRTNPSEDMENADQDVNGPAVHANPRELSSPVQETPVGRGFVADGPDHKAVAGKVLWDEKIPSDIPPVETAEKDTGSVVTLLGHNASEHFRTRWNEVQATFVDDPRSAVQDADALVSDVIEKITQMFANEHGALEAQWKEGKDVSTEDLRKALQHYRSFFNRLVV